MIIRAGEAGERDSGVSIWLDALRARDGREPGPEVAARAHAKFEQTIVRFAVAGTEPEGFALTIEENGASEQRVARLELLAVGPEHSGRGLGRALLDDAVKSATRAGFAVIELQVRSGNTAARKLYSSAGFTLRGNPAPHPLGGQPMVGYALQLGEPRN